MGGVRWREEGVNFVGGYMGTSVSWCSWTRCCCYSTRFSTRILLCSQSCQCSNTCKRGLNALRTARTVAHLLATRNDHRSHLPHCPTTLCSPLPRLHQLLRPWSVYFPCPQSSSLRYSTTCNRSMKYIHCNGNTQHSILSLRGSTQTRMAHCSI